MAGQNDFFAEVNQYFDQAARFTEYPEGLLDQIRCCNSVYRFDFPLRRANGGHCGVDCREYGAGGNVGTEEVVLIHCKTPCRCAAQLMSSMGSAPRGLRCTHVWRFPIPW